MKRLPIVVSAAAYVLTACSWAQAHFIFIVADPASGEARVYFSEGPQPDDPEFLKPLADAKLTAFEPRDASSELALELKDDALVARLGNAYAVGMSFDYGVMERGGETFMLKYHAAAHSAPIARDWKRLGGADKLALEVVPRQKDRQVELTVYWHGKPLADALIVAEGAGIEKAEGKTDAEGRFTVQPKEQGLLAVRAKHVETESGTFKEKAYASIRHWTTLTVPVSVPTVKSVDAQLPAIPQGITSFGAAIIGDTAYVYGGQWGGAHHYWKEGQSDELLRLNLSSGTEWEKLASGPRRTGTAMVAHNGKLLRIGGFEARNAEADEADLHSSDDVQRFVPEKNQWEPFSSMPLPRSSHDAALLGDTIYVVGGWNLQNPGDGEFHDSMLSLDLKAEQLEWKTSPVPFKRRALSVAVHDGNLYAIGGMQSEGGPSTKVDVYDPESGAWSVGPALHGQPMEGFGSTAFEIDGKLTAVTSSGAIQQLSSDGKSWIIAGTLQHPRFFARLLPISGGRGLVIAGADMVSGKVTETEVIAGDDNSALTP